MLSLSPDGRRLVQQPAPEVARLRRCYRSHPGDGTGASAAACGGAAGDSAGQAEAAAAAGAAAAGAAGTAAVSPDFSGRGGWYAEGVGVAEEQPLPVQGVAGAQLDVELCFSRWAGVAACSPAFCAPCLLSRQCSPRLPCRAEGRAPAAAGVASPCTACCELSHAACLPRATHPRPRPNPPPRRGTATAAGLLLFTHEAGSQGNALITYSWPTNALEVTFGVHAPMPSAPVPPAIPASQGSPSAAAAGLHLPPPAAGISPRKAGQGPASPLGSGGTASPPGSPAAAAVSAAAEQAAEAQLAALAEPLPEAAAVEGAVAAGAAAAAAPARRLGGPLAAPAADEEGRVRLRLLIDGSVVEVFSGTGEVRLSLASRGLGYGAPGKGGWGAAQRSIMPPACKRVEHCS